jgi:hypothetical protein
VPQTGFFESSSTRALGAFLICTALSGLEAIVFDTRFAPGQSASAFRHGQSCRIPNRLSQKLGKDQGVFSECVSTAVVNDIEALAVFQNKIQFIAVIRRLSDNIFGDDLKNIYLSEFHGVLESIPVRDLIGRSPPPPVKPVPLVKNDRNSAEVKHPASHDGKEKK